MNSVDISHMHAVASVLEKLGILSEVETSKLSETAVLLWLAEIRGPRV